MFEKSFVIDSLPRTGSTSLAVMLSCHPNVRCLIEPFHPARYFGQYNRQVIDIASLREVLKLIWLRWTGIKHVWQVPGHWPFSCDSGVNEDIISFAPAVISIERQNLLQRYVSSMISRELRFWIGSRAEFLARLERTCFREFDIETAREALKMDWTAMQRRRQLIASHPYAITVTYEDLFGLHRTELEKLNSINNLLAFLGFSSLDLAQIETQSWKEVAETNSAKWSSPEVYEKIPGIHALEASVGSDETGWLFR